MTARLVLYGRTHCHLCDGMVRALEGLRENLDFSLRVVDVDSDPALEALHGERVPVLADSDGREICHYFLDAGALRARLALK